MPETPTTLEGQQPLPVEVQSSLGLVSRFIAGCNILWNILRNPVVLLRALQLKALQDILADARALGIEGYSPSASLLFKKYVLMGQTYLDLYSMDPRFSSFLDLNQSYRERSLNLFLYLFDRLQDSEESSLIDEVIVIGQVTLWATQGQPASSDTLPPVFNTLEDINHMSFVDAKDSLQILRLLSQLYQLRFDRTEYLEDIDVAIALRHKCIDVNTGNKDLDESVLCIHLVSKFLNTEDFETILEAIVHGRAALQTVFQDDPVIMRNLASALQARYSHVETEGDIEKCGISGFGMATALDVYEKYTRIGRLQFHRVLDDDSDLDSHLITLLVPTFAMMFSKLYHLLIYLCDISATKDAPERLVVEEAILIGQSVLQMSPTANLDEHFVKVVAFPPSLHPLDICNDVSFAGDESGVKLKVLGFMSTVYNWRFEQTNNLEDIDLAIAFCRKHMEEKIKRNPNLNTESLSHTERTLCAYLIAKYEVTKDFETINDAVGHGRASLQGASKEDPIFLHRLATALGQRYRIFDTDNDLDNSIMLMRSALKIIESGKETVPEDTHVFLQAELVAGLSLMMHKSDEPVVYADECIGLLRKLVKDAPSDHSDFMVYRFELANILARRAEYVDDDQGLDEAISIMEQFVGERDKYPSHLHRNHINDIAWCLSLRFRKSRSIPDIDRCLKLMHEVLEGLPVNDSTSQEVANAKGTMALAYWHRYQLQGLSSDLALCIEYCSRENLSALPVTKLRLAMTSLYASVNHEAGRFQAAMHGYAEALELLPQFLLFGRNYRRQSSGEDGWYKLGAIAAAACIAGGEYQRALELLELGRSMGWTRGLQMRTSLDELTVDHPDYAERFKRLSKALEKAEHGQLLSGTYNRAADDLPIVEASWEEQFSLSKKWDLLLSEIRALGGYEDFLSAPRYDQFKCISERHPAIVINISWHRSDAFILTPSTLDRPQVVRLPDRMDVLTKLWSEELLEGIKNASDGSMTEADFSRFILRPILRELWRNVVQPIRESLNVLAPYARRISWCPTGRLTFLPLHLVTNGYNNDDAISYLPLIPSYTITLSTLLRARSSTDQRKHVRMLAVSCQRPRDSNHQKIPGTSKEIKTVAGLFAGHETTILQGSNATVERVLSEMPKHTWLHLGCHGIQSAEEPYRSHLALSDGPLHMADIVSSQLESPAFAFLSACQTATGIPILSDEAMHLAAGLHFAGFCGTIATMWSVHDKTAMRLAKEFYTFLFREPNVSPNVEDAAEALWRATQILRDEGVPMSRLAPFIHIGV